MSAHKSESLKFTYEVTSEPDSFLCLAVVLCYEKALKKTQQVSTKIYY